MNNRKCESDSSVNFDENPETLTLYHYSCLLHLPAILDEGIAKGEVASFRNTRKITNAVSLTSQTDHDRLYLWSGSSSLPFKTAVRYVCHLPTSDPHLRSAQKVWRELGESIQVIKAFDPMGQSKWWHFYFGVIPRERFTVEFWGRDGYVPVSKEHLCRIVSEVNQIRERFFFYSPPDEPTALYVIPRDPLNTSDLWIMKESHPADRFLTSD